MNYFKLARQNFVILNKLLAKSIFLPDTMQEFCRSNRYNFSKYYLNKFLLFSWCAKFSVFTKKVSYILLRYFLDLWFIKNNDKVFISGKWDLHDMLLENNVAKSLISNKGCKYIFTYKDWKKTQEVANQLNISILNNINTIMFLSDKKNLYKIFSSKYLPLLYTKSDLSFKNFVIKPRLWANSRGIFVANGRFIEKNLWQNKTLLIQEYIKWTICHSITFINKSGDISILYTAQQTIQKVEKRNGCFGFEITNSFITSQQFSQYKKYYDEILSLVLSKKHFFNWITIFLIEFIITENWEIKIMEINPRVWSSMVMANFLFFQSWISNQREYCLLNQNFRCKKWDNLIKYLKDQELLFLWKNMNSVLPINFSKRYNIIDLIIIWKNKNECSNIIDLINRYIKNEKHT